MLVQIENYILLFFIYSFAGWFVELTREYIRNKKVVNRGFLVGPYCPIYGCGAILITFLLQKYSDDALVTFVLSTVICGILEYLTSYIMEKIFKARWWDYSDRKFNINGRICLENLVWFGLGGTIVVNYINPLLLDCFKVIPELLSHIILGIIMIGFLVDIIVSLRIIFNLKEMKKELRDNTIEISAKVRKIILKKLILYRRLVNAFPKIKDNVKFSTWDDIKKKIEESTRNIKIKKSKNTSV
mgnify:CR=1 FL=1